MKNFKYILLLLTIIVFGCKKEIVDDVKDNSKISAIIADNFNLSVFNTALVRTGLAKQIDQEGPFTAIAPSDDAFRLAGYPNSSCKNFCYYELPHSKWKL